MSNIELYLIAINIVKVVYNPYNYLEQNGRSVQVFNSSSCFYFTTPQIPSTLIHFFFYHYLFAYIIMLPLNQLQMTGFQLALAYSDSLNTDSLLLITIYLLILLCFPLKQLQMTSFQLALAYLEPDAQWIHFFLSLSICLYYYASLDSTSNR